MEEKIEVMYDLNSSVDLDFQIGDRLYKINILRDKKGKVRQLKIIKVRGKSDTITLGTDEFKILRYLREEELKGAI